MEKIAVYNKFFLKLTEQILECQDIYLVENILTEIMKFNPAIQNLEIYSYDEIFQKLKNFSKPWISISASDHKILYEKFCLLDTETFSFNNEFYPYNKQNIEDFTGEYYFAITKNNTKLGLLKIVVSENDDDLMPLLKILKNLITLCVSNLTITTKMENNIRFYDAMKNIAKIIESQYEPNYVIPLIGEMIDRFLEEQLVYIFIKTEDGYKLAWPGACKRQDILPSLDDLSLETPFFVMNDMQTGVFAMISENTILGAVVAYSNIVKLNYFQIDYLKQLVKQSATTLQRAYVYAEILEHATLDALTGLNNRRQFEARLNQEVATAKRKKTDLCSIMIDVDHFKAVNDTYGHLAGDCVLKQVAQIVKHELREYDTACRYGGEEFIILLPFTALPEALYVAQRLRKTIEETNIDITEAHVAGTTHLNITISAGVSIFDENTDTSQSFYQKADAALYDAKNSGRNRVMAFEENK